MENMISGRELNELMSSETLYAVFDVRERGEYNECQIPNATSLPRSQIEFRIAELVPNRRIPIMVYDEGGERATLAVRTLNDLGYSELSVLGGGLPAWQQAGYPTISGVNVPSKAFGERIHQDRRIPDIAPEELRALQKHSADLLILDVRTPEEYGRFCIPGGMNVPGGDLILWAEELRQKPAVIVNCAGRTRSIIGAAALRRLGLTNVRALRNGTMGWVLAGLDLESKPTRGGPSAPAESRAKATALALRVAEEEKIPSISVQELVRVAGNPDDGVAYLIDVRSESDYQSGHVAGSLNVPGGQAVQRADDFIPVRNGRIIFISDQGARAVMAAYWYKGMGFRDVWVLKGGIESWSESGRLLAAGTGRKEPLGFQRAKRLARLIEPAEIRQLLQDPSIAILDVGSSIEYEAAHLPKAKWLSRGWLDLKLPKLVTNRDQAIVISCPDGRNSVFAARTLSELGYKNVFALKDGVRAWVLTGDSIESGLTSSLTEPNDVVLSPSIKGAPEEMRRYLEWEVKLKG